MLVRAFRCSDFGSGMRSRRTDRAACSAPSRRFARFQSLPTVACATAARACALASPQGDGLGNVFGFFEKTGSCPHVTYSARGPCWATSKPPAPRRGPTTTRLTWTRTGRNQLPSAVNSRSSQPESRRQRSTAFVRVRSRLSPMRGGGQGQDRTVDLPLFRRSVVSDATG